MHRSLFIPLLAGALAMSLEARAETADGLARQVAEAAGDPYAEAFVGFSFVVKKDGEELLRRKHAWCPREGIVEVDGVRISAVDGSPVGDTSVDAANAAWAAFINDAYWIFAPAKLMDRGVDRTLLDDGRLQISFGEVGLTPGDVYSLRFDEQNRLVHWAFTLESGKKGEFTWEDYVQKGDLWVARAHHAVPEGAGPSIFIDAVRVADACPL